ncbi:MAG: serine/threonine protein kinase, partial [Planctomycetales bacterium]|nr:serine/threonine protein kinase [Planctomycetales bacterium]
MTINRGKDELGTFSVDELLLLEQLCDKFESAYPTDKRLKIEELVSTLPNRLKRCAIINLIQLEIELRNADAKTVASEFRSRFAAFQSAVDEALCEDPPAVQGQPNEHPIPDRIDRYEIKKVLGAGAFGRVYLAHDSDMDRMVALKVPSAKLFESGQAVQTFLQEARSAAKIKHPALITVHDVQRQADQPFIVQEYVQGTNLADWLKQNTLSLRKIVELVVEIAEALVELHRHDVVHRDLKPANILIDADGHVHVADFGLALHSSWQHERKGEVAGSPAYMSPEQTRGETHRIDGRTDIWSLGVILYEMLVGQRPFVGKTTSELWESIRGFDARPPSMRNPEVPLELDRICLLCLAKQQADRFTSATHLLRELKEWLAETSSDEEFTKPQISLMSRGDGSQPDTDRIAETSRGEPRVIPRGLRSFEESDADFFLTLLPGVPDKSGLPPSVSFWKSRIEETDEDATFAVGVMYGPSGCGKSSLVKAGILPRLNNHVVSVYVEATPHDTEVRLLKALRKRVPGFDPGKSDLPTALRTLRGQSEHDSKILIVLDQFEQWLHAHGEDPDEHLIQALRQCDGTHVQCLVLIRDDFWMPVTRFMRLLEIRLLEDETVKAVDLFSIRHAEKVLTKFGRAYGAIDGRCTDDHDSFIAKSIRGLATEGKVICVQLALFAQMMHDKPWTPETFHAVGGTEGIGVTFLEETFSSTIAPKRHRVHQAAARSVLESLLPKSGTDIKGTMRSREEVLNASNYGNRPDDFDELLRILDAELRLITPTDPDGRTDPDSESDASKRYYQLTHDFLVPSLREWITRKRKETRRGRAELRLAELASLWKSKREKRHLPSFWEYLTIRVLTNPASWDDEDDSPQVQLMRVADRFYLASAATVAVIVISLIGTGWLIQRSAQRDKAKTLVGAALTSQQPQLPMAATNLRPFKTHAVGLLQGALGDETNAALVRFKAAFVLAELGSLVDPTDVCELVSELPDDEETNANILACLKHTELESASSIKEFVEAQFERTPTTLRFGTLCANLGDAEVLSSVLSDDSNPTHRTMFIHETVPKWKSSFVSERLVRTLRKVDDPDLRSAIALAVGATFKGDPLATSRWAGVLHDWYQAADPGTHCAAEWSLRQLKLDLPSVPLQDAFDLNSKKEWQVFESGLTLLKIPKGQFGRR